MTNHVSQLLYPLRFQEILRDYSFGDRWLVREFEKAGSAHGQLLVGTDDYDGGIYRLAGGALTAYGGIVVGGQNAGNLGRFEWYAGSMGDRPRLARCPFADSAIPAHLT